jgi:hypothetical protein
MFLQKQSENIVLIDLQNGQQFSGDLNAPFDTLEQGKKWMSRSTSPPAWSRWAIACSPRGTLQEVDSRYRL